jgi:ADP-heptose:LPS heptosyltransferase
MQLARMTGIKNPINLDLIPLAIPTDVEQNAIDAFNKLFSGNAGKIIGINVNASNLSLARRWPIDRFAQVAQYFVNMGRIVLLFGSNDERAYVQTIYNYIHAESIKNSIINSAGIFQFGEMCAILKKCDVLITNDTGIMNIAYAQSVKVIAIYGPNIPIRYHVFSKSNKAIYKKFYCSPCIHHLYNPPCNNEDCAPCLSMIGVDDVISAVSDCLFKNRTHSIKNTNAPMSINSQINNYLCGSLRRRGENITPENVYTE